MARAKISLIGGGQIGGNLALLAAQKELGDVFIFDIPKAEGMVKGKALDLMQLRPHDGYDSNISGTSNWEDLRDSDVFIVTAGIPRKPGMNREDLLATNLGIIKDVALNIKKPPMKIIIKFHLSFNKWNFVSKKEIRIENKKNIPLIGSAVARKNVPKLKHNWPILFVLWKI